MIAEFDRYYAAKADAIARGPQLYGGDAAIAALRCFKRYSPNAHTDIIEGRWTTDKQARIYAIAKRLEVNGEGMTMRAIAIECQVVASTVSRALMKFQAWGLIAVDVTRGKYGGVRVHKVPAHVLSVYIAAAKQKLRDLWRRRFNVAFTRELGGTSSSLSPSSYGRNIKTFAEQVLHARAYLALEDPEGEYEAVRPLVGDLAERAMWDAEDRRRHQDELVRQAAFDGDWDLWEKLRAERWSR